MVLCVCVGFRPIGLCILTVWASIRDLASIKSFTVIAPDQLGELTALLQTP